MRIILSFLLIYSFAILVTAQKAMSIDTLERRLEKQELPALQRFHILNELTRDTWKVSAVKSIKYGKMGLELAENMDNDSCKIEILNNLGVAYYYSSSYELALNSFFQALVLAGKRNDLTSSGMLYNSIANVYLATMMYDKALIYYRKSLDIRTKKSDTTGMATNYINISRLYSTTGRSKEAWNYLWDAIRLLELIRDSARLSTAYNNLGLIYRDMNNLPKALEFNRKALRLSMQLNQTWEIGYIRNSLGEVFLDRDQYDSALACFRSGLASARQIKSLDLALYSYRNLTIYYCATGNYKEFLSTFSHYNQVRDSIFTNQVNNSIAEMQVKYETEAKEKENALQKLEINRQRSLRNSFIFTSVLILIFVVILYYRYRVKKNQSVLLEAKVEERTLELRKSEQRILRNTIETEERERTRFSEDLHDGLGPLLSTVKIHLELIRSHKESLDEQEKYIRLADDLLDEALRSTREIANNLVPNVLNDFGLLEALKDYIEKINRMETVKINFMSSGLEIRPNQDIETAIYRIAFELINNTLRHAHATQIEMQMEEMGPVLEFSYQDDGIGLDWNEVSARSPKGLGIQNIISRVRSLNGEYEFDTGKEKSFGIYIRIPLTPVKT
jgi:two-component system, NarL family, sensor kinase